MPVAEAPLLFSSLALAVPRASVTSPSVAFASAFALCALAFALSCAFLLSFACFTLRFCKRVNSRPTLVDERAAPLICGVSTTKRSNSWSNISGRSRWVLSQDSERSAHCISLQAGCTSRAGVRRAPPHRSWAVYAAWTRTARRSRSEEIATRGDRDASSLILCCDFRTPGVHNEKKRRKVSHSYFSYTERQVREQRGLPTATAACPCARPMARARVVRARVARAREVRAHVG